MNGIRKIFKDLLSRRNRIHWRRSDINYFLSTKGKIILECFQPIQLEETDNLVAMIKSRNLENVEKIIICVYDSVYMSIADYEKLVECIIDSIPINQDKTSILTGWIDDERIGINGISVTLVAMCSDNKKDKNIKKQSL